MALAVLVALSVCPFSDLQRADHCREGRKLRFKVRPVLKRACDKLSFFMQVAQAVEGYMIKCCVRIVAA